MTTMTKMIAITGVQLCPGTESEVTGYREDGSPITKLIVYRYKPGEKFEVVTSDVARLVDIGAATTDLTYVPPILGQLG